MGIIDSLLYKHFGPVFVKEDSDAESFIQKMKTLSCEATGKTREKIEQQIRAAESGLFGERQIAYELKNSGMDMLVAHDLYLEKNSLSAQIDFLVLTRKHGFVIESKNLYGNIEIDEKGNFIRHIGSGKFYHREGFTSPISQNERHLNVIKEIRKEYKTNFVTQGIFDNLFPQSYRSVVVLANPKTILNDKKAPEEIRKMVIRADQLVSYIKKVEESDDLYKSSEKELHELMDSILQCNKPNPLDYAKKYENLLKSCRTDENMNQEKRETTPEKVCPKCRKPLVLRTAKKGENAGNKFWGCSGFPKCWYRENENP